MIHDPAVEPYVEEQRRYLTVPGGHPGGGPVVSAEMLPAEQLVLPSGVGVRIIAPEEVRAAMLHIHAGGFTFGSAAMADANNSRLARATGIATISVEYRLAPQHPHPAALDDCVAAALWLIDHARGRFGSERLLIGGESVGATLSVLTLLRLRDQHAAAGRFAGAHLLAGNFDLSMTPSQRLAPETYFLSPKVLRDMQAAAFPGVAPEALRDPSISPLYAELGGMPPAIFTVSTHDSVLDDSLFMAQRWRAAGGEAELHVYPEGAHGFMNLPTRMAEEARRRVFRFLSRQAGG